MRHPPCGSNQVGVDLKFGRERYLFADFDDVGDFGVVHEPLELHDEDWRIRVFQAEQKGLSEENGTLVLAHASDMPSLTLT